MQPVGILVTGDPVPLARAARGSFTDMIRRALGDDFSGAVRELRAEAAEPLPDAAELSALVITGSAASVTERAPWMLRSERWLVELVGAGLPIFGLCFGHQLLARALGGQVTANARGREIGTVVVRRTRDDELFVDAELEANMTHVDSVAELPPGAHVVAATDLDPHAAIRFAERVWGVQFHPEFDAATLRAYIRQRAEILTGEGFEPEALEAAVGDAPRSRALLSRFIRAVS
jgi:GMP synthase (glutamine-hydrolysing)